MKETFNQMVKEKATELDKTFSEIEVSTHPSKRNRLFYKFVMYKLAELEMQIEMISLAFSNSDARKSTKNA